MANVVDVIVTDGFTGKIALKLIEGVSSPRRIAGHPRCGDDLAWRAKLGGLAACVRRCSGLREQIDPEVTGGAYMLGLRQIGDRLPRAVHPPPCRLLAKAIELAALGVEEDVIGRTRAALEEAGALRSPADGGSDSDEGAAKRRITPFGVRTWRITVNPSHDS